MWGKGTGCGGVHWRWGIEVRGDVGRGVEKCVAGLRKCGERCGKVCWGFGGSEERCGKMRREVWGSVLGCAWI